MNTYIELDTNSVMGEEIRKTIEVLSDMLMHHPLTEVESECLDMARFYLSRVNRAMTFQLKVRKEDEKSCLNCGSSECELGNRDRYGFCGNWTMKEGETE